MSGAGFFSISLEDYYVACELGLNEACLYIVQACGTGKTNVQTSWSVNALTKYTSISRGRAKKAQSNLLNSSRRLMCQIKGGNHPKFEFVRSEDCELVWLPSTFVLGAASETPPLERIRQTGDVFALRLLVDLYSRTNIAEDAGVSSEVIYQSYNRVKLASHAEFEVYGFGLETTYCYPNNPIVAAHTTGSDESERSRDFFSRIETINRLGLFTYVPVLFEAGEGEWMFPLINPFTGEVTTEITECAELLLPEQYDSIFPAYDYVIPIPKHFQSVELRGVLFPQYQQQTELTKAGYARVNEAIKSWGEIYTNLKGAISREYQGSIKGSSRYISRGNQ